MGNSRRGCSYQWAWLSSSMVPFVVSPHHVQAIRCEMKMSMPKSVMMRRVEALMPKLSSSWFLICVMLRFFSSLTMRSMRST